MPDALLDTPSPAGAFAPGRASAPDVIVPDMAASRAEAALLFGDNETPPVWLWLAMEQAEVTALERALINHLRSPAFPTRMAEKLTTLGDDAALLDFARQFAPIAPRFTSGSDLVIAALRIVAERGGKLCRAAAIAAVEAILHRLHMEARALADPTRGERTRRFVLASRLAADLWVRFVPGVDSGSHIASRLAEATAGSVSAPAIVHPAPAPTAPAIPPQPRPSVTVLQPFEPPNDKAEWNSYRPLAAPVPLRPLARDAVARMLALEEQAPAFAAPLREIRRALALASHAGRPAMRMRPILLVGPPGVGKTWFARRIAQALDLPFSGLNLGGATDNRCLQGTARGWSAATPAWPISEMARLAVPNPLFFLDEIEKAGGQRETNGRAHDTLLAMIEPESASAWFDECLHTTADLRNCVWIMAANETRGISAPLLSRLSVHNIEPPPASAFGSSAAALRGAIAADLGCTGADLPELGEAAMEAMRRSFTQHRNLRRLRAQMEECLGLAAEAALRMAN